MERVVITANFLPGTLIFAAISSNVPSLPVSWTAAIAGGVSPRGCSQWAACPVGFSMDGHADFHANCFGQHDDCRHANCFG